jgi:transcriptional regulator with PAS, ATPase and Fis domain
LLRVLQDRTYEPLGATRPVSADVRIIAATNCHLSDLLEEGIFRRDLYYRINVVRLVLPPLRERREDIPLLVEHFVSRFNRLQGRHLAGASPEVLEILMSYDFHGNVRELENIIEYAFVVCGGEVIQPQHLPEGLRPAIVSARQFSGPETLEDAEKRLIINALERNGWNRLAAARELDIHKSTLFRKLKRFDIRLPSVDGRSRKN